jgi:hypothetical protein
VAGVLATVRAGFQEAMDAAITNGQGRDSASLSLCNSTFDGGAGDGSERLAPRVVVLDGVEFVMAVRSSHFNQVHESGNRHRNWTHIGISAGPPPEPCRRLTVAVCSSPKC